MSRPTAAHSPHVVWGSCALLLLVYTTVRMPLVNRQWHPDEQHNIAFHIAGYEKVPFPFAHAAEARPRSPLSAAVGKAMIQSSERVKAPAVHVQPWTRTLFHNEQGNNSPPASAVARLSNEVWRWLADQPAPRVNSWAVRLPSWLAGAAAMLCVFALALRSMGLVAALASGSLFAIHPLVVDLSTLMRGYSLLLLAQTLSWWCYHRALADGDRRAWWIGAAATGCALWAFPGYGYAMLATQGWILFSMRERMRHGEWKPWALSHGVIALLWAVIALPAFRELLALMNTRYPFDSHHLLWAPRLLAQGFSGLMVPGYDQAPLAMDADTGAALAGAWHSSPFAVLFAWVIIPGLIALGILRLIRRGQGWLAGCLMATCAGALCSIVHQAIAGHELLPWYGIYLAPVACLSLAALIPSRNSIGCGIAIATVASFGAVTFPNGRPGRLELFPPKQSLTSGFYHDSVALLTLPNGRTLLAIPPKATPRLSPWQGKRPSLTPRP